MHLVTFRLELRGSPAISQSKGLEEVAIDPSKRKENATRSSRMQLKKCCNVHSRDDVLGFPASFNDIT